MNINKLIEKINNIHPNSFSNNDKTAWAHELDMELYQKAMQFYGFKEPVEYSEGVPLYLGKGGAKLYELYILSQMDYFNDDIAVYNNRILLFNDALLNFLNWLTANNKYTGKE
ncbi:MAG: hypothetical protein GYA87_02835 [Christensenellaceae bacterium]|nr:hypothetical protein [Christensenellaceae bacterium]